MPNPNPNPNPNRNPNPDQVSWKWGEGDVTLLGDAAHAQLPALGLGVSTALGELERQIYS